jgi:hypothetical protein
MLVYGQRDLEAARAHRGSSSGWARLRAILTPKEGKDPIASAIGEEDLRILDWIENGGEIPYPEVFEIIIMYSECSEYIIE